MAERSALSCVFAGRRSVRSRLDNCYSDHAVVNGRQLIALLRGEDPDTAAEQLRLQAQKPDR